MKKLFCLLSLLLSHTLLLVAQAPDEEKAGKLTPKEFSIPPSPVFDLMGVTPSQINRTSDIKDFKVDWSFKDWKLNPNLAIQSQPFWEILYNRKDLSKYQMASPFMRKLASLDLSIGTVQNEENDRRIGFALKMNVLKQKDPLMAKELYEEIGLRYAEEKLQLEAQLKQLQTQLDSSNSVLEKPQLRSQIQGVEQQLLSIHSRRNEEINTRARVFVAENWNAASLDLAFGKVYTYQSDSAGALKKLRLNRNTGWGAWVNGAVPIGKKMLVSGLLRTTWYEEELTFLLRDKTTLDETTGGAVVENKIYSMGLNLRYGSPLYSFFVEFLMEKKAIKTPVAALQKVFDEPANLEIVDASVQWLPLHPNTISIGGDWRISRNVIVNYGMRWIMDNNFKTQAFIPVAGISCMMR